MILKSYPIKLFKKTNINQKYQKKSPIILFNDKAIFFIKFINKEINTKEALEISSLKKSTFFRYLKEFKEKEE